jgi:soluble lytic murein transglycosylase-like protein
MLLFNVPVSCINQVAMEYHIPAIAIVSVLKAEGGKVGMANRNKNGTEDLGPMQINSIWLEQLKVKGYTKKQLQYDPCVNVKVGTWILAQKIASGKDWWNGVGNYNSYTQSLNEKYRTRVKRNYEVLAKLM